MNAQTKRSAFTALGQGMLGGLQWRLMLLWVWLTLLPTLVVALPLWRVLDEAMGHSVHASEWAAHFDGLVFGDIMALLQRNNWVGTAFAAGALLTLAISPFLAGMVVAGGRANRALGFGALLQGGATEYGRMLRLLPLSLVPYALFAIAAKAVSGMADDKIDVALLPSTADTWHHVALGLTLLCFVIAQAVIESARAQFIADITLRSALRAFGRGVVQFIRRPLANVVVYLVISGLGMGMAVLIAAWRGHIVGTGAQWLVGLLIVQLGVIVVAWMRTARLLAIAGLSSFTQQRRRRADFAPAL